MLGEERMNRGAELADSFAVNDAEFEDSAFAAKGDVIENNGLHVLRPEGVQIQNAVDRQLNWIDIVLVAHRVRNQGGRGFP